MPRKRRVQTAPHGTSPQKIIGLDRRSFLKLAGISAAAAGAPELTGCQIIADPPGGGRLNLDFTATLIRKEDFVVLRFEFVNLVLNKDGSALVSRGRGDRFIIVVHPSQHILEQALDEAAPPWPTPQPVEARIAGPSRIVFKVPDDVTSIDFTAEKLLDACAKFEMNVSRNALPPDEESVRVIAPDLPGKLNDARRSLGEILGLSSTEMLSAGNVIGPTRALRGQLQIAQSSGIDIAPSQVAQATQLSRLLAVLSPGVPLEPRADETSLELPFRLLISPNHLGGWAHANLPVESPQKRVELWHTRLGVRNADGTVDESPKTASLRTVRALWAREHLFDADNPCTYKSVDPDPDPTWLASLTSSDRIALVHQTSNFRPIDCTALGTPRVSVRPQPVNVNLLMLSGLGGWLDSHGEWGSAPLYGIESWDHRAVMARDNYVKVVYSGVLFPFGHRASLVKITERKFRPEAPHTAYLWQRRFLIVREPVKTYPSGLRQFPFTQLHVKTLVTPDLDLPDGDAGTNSPPPVFVPRVDGSLFRFATEGLDQEGNVVKFDAGVVWVPTAFGKVYATDVPTAEGKFTASVAKCDVKGQRVAFGKSSKPDDTTFETETLYFDDISSGKPGLGAPSIPTDLKFLPVIEKADIQVEAIRHLSGQELPSGFKYNDTYLEHDFGGPNNAGDLFLEVAGSAVGLNFGKKSDRSGGFVAPSLDIKALSRRTGPVAGKLDKAASGVFDPKSFLASVDAKIFGVFKLMDIVDDLLGAAGLDEAPKFITQALDTIESFLSDLERIQDDVARLQSELGSVDAIFKSLTDAAAKLVTDVGKIDATDPDKLQAGIDLVVDTDLPAVSAALAAIPAELELPAIKSSVSEGIRQAISLRVGQVTSVVASISGTLKDVLKAFKTGADLAKNLTVRLDWRPTIQKFPSSDPIFDPDPKGLLLAVEVRAKAQEGKPAGVDLLASLENFKIHLIAPATFMTLSFTKLQFKMESGKKPDVDVVFDELVFDGVLHFVENLKKIIPLTGFSDPPALDVSTEGIKASFSLELPSIACGMFALQNISLGAGFNVPFIGPPLSVSFNFCTKENPCNLTVTFLGGGMWFGITIDPSGVQLLEAGFEFGATLAVDLGVASGSVCIMAGFYFRMESDNAQLSGYLRMRGEVDVLGLITASIELRLELNYEFSSKKLTGRASIEIEISVCMFSFSVSVTAERKFSGTNDDPSFEDVMQPPPLSDDDTSSPWSQYLGAFVLAA